MQEVYSMTKQQHSKSILQRGKYCFETGMENVPLERHHTMNGTAYRKKAEEDGLWIWLMPQVHQYIHGTSEGHKLLIEYKRLSQTVYEMTHTREEWIERYGKNYL